MKILNLYAGIGGNRKLLGDEHEIVAIENVPEIAKIYQDFFPNDKVIITDAHQYLLDHFEDFDFIWSSPPCPSHSKVRRLMSGDGQQNKPIFPDMKLYEEILLLKYYFKGKWVVENVMAFYKPLIKPFELQRHWFWSNFPLPKKKFESDNIRYGNNESRQDKLGFDLKKYKGVNKTLLLRNCVKPELGLYIFNLAFKEPQLRLDEGIFIHKKIKGFEK